MFADAKLIGTFQLVACSAGLEYMGAEEQAVTARVDAMMGLPAIFEIDRRRRNHIVYLAE